MSDNSALFPATVVKVIDDYLVVINRGSDHGIKKGDAFLVYFVEGDELHDPNTGEALGHLEIVRGSGSATHVQPKLTTLRTNRTTSSRTVRTGGLSALYSPVEQEVKLVPYEDAAVGDFAKPV
jgi:hypothetical protein